MYICTLNYLAEKNSRGETIPSKMFIKDYAEAAGQVRKVKIEKTTDPGFLMVVSYPTYRDVFANPKTLGGIV